MEGKTGRCGVSPPNLEIPLILSNFLRRWEISCLLTKINRFWYYMPTFVLLVANQTWAKTLQGSKMLWTTLQNSVHWQEFSIKKKIKYTPLRKFNTEIANSLNNIQFLRYKLVTKNLKLERIAIKWCADTECDQFSHQNIR